MTPLPTAVAPTLHQGAAPVDSEGSQGAGKAPCWDGLGSPGRYERLQTLGAGGMGEVDLSRDRTICRPVALKRLRPELRETAAVEHFAREARILGRLEHPNILPVHDVGLDEAGRHCLVMPFLEGATLADVIEELAQGNPAYHQRFHFTQRLLIFRAICEAMEHAHSRGVLHRDLKPENVMVGPRGQVIVLDWGVARDAADPLDAPGTLVGTPAYMAPEQAAGHHDAVSERTDGYALCLILYELMTLTHPLQARDSVASVLEGVRTVVPAPAVTIRGANPTFVPIEVSHFLTRGLAKVPDHRWASVAAMREEIDRIIAGRFRVQCPTTLAKRALLDAARLVDRQPALAYVGLIAVVVLIGVALIEVMLSALA